MSMLVNGVNALATRIANYLRDTILPRLVPAGGSTGQVLAKASATNHHLAWADAAAGGGAATPSRVNTVVLFCLRMFLVARRRTVFCRRLLVGA